MTDESVHAETAVSYTVRELFEKVDMRFDKQDAVLDAISKRMDGMATKDDISEVHHRVDELEHRTTVLEEDEKSARISYKAEKAQAARFRNVVKWWLAAIVIPLGSALILVYLTHH